MHLFIVHLVKGKKKLYCTPVTSVDTKNKGVHATSMLPATEEPTI